MNTVLRWMLAVLMLGGAIGNSHAQERILSFDSNVRIAADGSLEVTEIITVRAEGSQIRRGIYRDFPTRYRDARGLRHSVDFEMVSLQRDGNREPWFTENRGNGVRVNFGNDDFLPVPGEFRYELRYRTRRQIGFFDTHDELYWNATGNDWAFAIERASARIELPQAVPVKDLRLDAYTGPTGSSGNASTVQAVDGAATWTLDSPLAPGSGMTVALGFPKGIVAAPSGSERLGWMLRDLAGLLVVALVCLIWIGGYVVLWWRFGRDPPAGTIVVQYEPPEGHSPAGLRYVRRYGYDATCFSADAVALAVAGALRIEHERGLLKGTWALHQRVGAGPNDVKPGSSLQALSTALFSGPQKVIELEALNRSLLMKAKAAHEAALKSQYTPSHFTDHTGWAVLGTILSILGGVFGLVLSAGNEATAIAVLVGGVVMFVASIVFSFLLRRPTLEGRKLLDQIEGLRRYLSVAERDELASLTSHEPRLDATRYQALLPYAMALDVESAWTKRFTATVGEVAAVEAARSAGWVGGSGFAGSNFTDMGSSLSRSFSSQIASSSTPPGSSSGGGGGGSSGGGGGGGGGGGR
jgi:uncharacterized membrane protein YgcG